MSADVVGACAVSTSAGCGAAAGNGPMRAAMPHHLLHVAWVNRDGGRWGAWCLCGYRGPLRAYKSAAESDALINAHNHTCDCHRTGAVHAFACCDGSCSGCGRFIQRGMMAEHIKTCVWRSKLSDPEVTTNGT